MTDLTILADPADPELAAMRYGRHAMAGLAPHNPGDYQPTHALATDEDAHMRPAPLGMVYWSNWYKSFRRITEDGSSWI